MTAASTRSCCARCATGPRRAPSRSVPPAAGEPAERDEPDERDDDSEHEAPEDRDDDPDDHDDAAGRDAAEAAPSASRHVIPPIGVGREHLCPADPRPETDP